jgi:hypothetical protein
LINVDATPPVTSGSAYCATLTESQLDILALELTRCEFIKSRREMFIADQSSDDSNSVSSDAKSACQLGTLYPSQPYQASACLEQLTDHAHDIYNTIKFDCIPKNYAAILPMKRFSDREKNPLKLSCEQLYYFRTPNSLCLGRRFVGH